jgi:hypothetical protein
MIPRLLALLCAAALGSACDSHDRPDGAKGDADPVDASDDVPEEEPHPRMGDLTVLARELEPFQGRALQLWLVEETGNVLVGRALVAAIEGPELEVRMPDLVGGGNYHIDVYIDGDDNGRYDGPEIDPSWRLTVPVTGSATVSFTPSQMRTDVSTPVPRQWKDFSITVEGLPPEEAGHRFELRVIDTRWRTTLGAYVHPQLPSESTLTITLPGIADEGAELRVDFWVDADGNGTYSGPDGDHTWRVPVTVDGSGAHVVWSWTNDFVELDWR